MRRKTGLVPPARHRLNMVAWSSGGVPPPNPGLRTVGAGTAGEVVPIEKKHRSGERRGRAGWSGAYLRTSPPWLPIRSARSEPVAENCPLAPASPVKMLCVALTRRDP